MKNKKFTATIFTIYILTLLSFILVLCIKFNAGKSNSDQRFNEITKDINRAIQNKNSGNEEFYASILNAINDFADINGIQIVKNSSLIFSYPKDLGQSSAANTTMVRSFSTSLQDEENNSYKLTCAIYLLTPAQIFNTGRICFLIILAATLAAIIYLIFFYKDDSNNGQTKNLDSQEKNQEDSNKFFDDKEDVAFNDKNDLNDEPSKNADEIFKQETIDEQNSKASEIQNDDEVQDSVEFVDESKNEDNIEIKDESMPYNADEDKSEANAESSIKPEKTGENPVGLFNPANGFGWEEYMITRLNSELIRASSSDQDLALMTIEFKGIDWTNETGKKVSELISNQVKFNDLIFNYKEDSLIIIFQDFNTDLAIKKAEEIFEAVSQITSGKNIETAIGISTKSLRLISAERIANESEQALIHAKEDMENPIVAFRVDPNKFKDYVSSESNKLVSSLL